MIHLQKTKFLEWPKLKEAVYRKFNMGQKWNNSKNGGKAGHPDFLLFPHCFNPLPHNATF